MEQLVRLCVQIVGAGQAGFHEGHLSAGGRRRLPAQEVCRTQDARAQRVAQGG